MAFTDSVTNMFDERAIIELKSVQRRRQLRELDQQIDINTDQCLHPEALSSRNNYTTVLGQNGLSTREWREAEANVENELRENDMMVGLAHLPGVQVQGTARPRPLTVSDVSPPEWEREVDKEAENRNPKELAVTIPQQQIMVVGGPQVTRARLVEVPEPRVRRGGLQTAGSAGAVNAIRPPLPRKQPAQTRKATRSHVLTSGTRHVDEGIPHAASRVVAQLPRGKGRNLHQNRSKLAPNLARAPPREAQIIDMRARDVQLKQAPPDPVPVTAPTHLTPAHPSIALRNDQRHLRAPPQPIFEAKPPLKARSRLWESPRPLVRGGLEPIRTNAISKDPRRPNAPQAFALNNQPGRSLMPTAPRRPDPRPTSLSSLAPRRPTQSGRRRAPF